MDGCVQRTAEQVEEGGFPVNLLQQMMEECLILNHVRTDDVFGGYKEAWEEGASFYAAIGKNVSPEQLVAEQQGISEQFTVVVDDTLVLDYHDVFKRKSDNKIFRVTSDGDDKHTPNSSALDMRQVSAEEYTLPINNT